MGVPLLLEAAHQVPGSAHGGHVGARRGWAGAAGHRRRSTSPVAFRSSTVGAFHAGASTLTSASGLQQVAEGHAVEARSRCRSGVLGRAVYGGQVDARGETQTPQVRRNADSMARWARSWGRSSLLRLAQLHSSDRPLARTTRTWSRAVPVLAEGCLQPGKDRCLTWRLCHVATCSTHRPCMRPGSQVQVGRSTPSSPSRRCMTTTSSHWWNSRHLAPDADRLEAQPSLRYR